MTRRIKEKNYQCIYCFKRFVRWSTVIRHLKRQYNKVMTIKQLKELGAVVKPELVKPRTSSKVKLETPEIPKSEETLKEESKFYLGLNEKQKEVFKLVEQGKNVFLTGSAGTGKSFLLKRIIEYLRGKYKDETKTEQELAVAVTSTTGINVTNISGGTLHSFSGIKIYSEERADFLLTLASKSEPKRRWKRAKHLIIDEISMLDGNLFDKLEWIARTIRNNQRPFGGIQLILSGDFCQLPPVTKKYWLEKYTKYCFEARSWKKVISREIELTEIFRQKKDLAYLNLLQNLRYGKLSEADINLIKTLSRKVEFNDNIKPVKLFATNEEVNEFNRRELNRIGEKEKSYFYDAKDWGLVPVFLTRLLDSCLAPTRLELKVGARVMLIANYPPHLDLWNGSQGVVIGFNDNYPKVKFTNGRIITVSPYEWTTQEWKKDGQLRKLASREQLPLILSWAVTVHKSQGQVIDRLEVDCARVFAFGHIYTAFSRCPTSQSLQIVNFDVNKVKVNEKVQQYYLSLQNQNT